MNVKKVLFGLVIVISFIKLNAQVVINEISNRNFTQILDEDEETEDWIELYNKTNSSINFENWTLTDNHSIIDKWTIPPLELPPDSIQLIFASGKDRRNYNFGYKWESAILPTDSFNYIIPDKTIHFSWNTLAYNVESWNKGIAGFGYGDDDDETIVPDTTRVIYIRRQFVIPDTQAITGAICHVDYDDGFVAYLNGSEICRSNISGTPTWDSFASEQHDAVMYEGGLPDEFELDMEFIRSIWNEGENVFAVEVHNLNTTSSDLTMIPFLSFKIDSGSSFFNDAPLWLSTSDGSNLHTNFKISSKGETIYLFNPQKELVDSLHISSIQLNHSFGRSVDGGDTLAIFENATPGTRNNLSTPYFDGYEEEPVFDIQAGFYSGIQNISLSTNSASCQIRYTTDGSTPSSSSTLYDGGSISISKTQTINAKCFSTGNKLPGKTQTATYFIDEDFSIPVLSVTTDRENLFGTTGIFTNWWESWNKPCYVEYFDTLKQISFGQSAGIQVDGGAGGSRSRPQTSFRIEPGNGTFGDGDLKYALQPDRPERDNYASFYIRNGSNQYLKLFYKDGAQVKGMGKNTHNFYSAYRPIVVFINGEYYGMYENREKINADYLESNYKMDTDSFNMVGISHFRYPGKILPTVGSVEPFNNDYDRFKAMNPASTNYLDEVGEILDLDNYTDYIAAQTWMTNKDWPYNNMKAWRCKGSDMRWQFAIIDLEWSFLPTITSRPAATRPSFDQTAYMLGKGTLWPASGYWYMLMQNNDYKHRFLNRICDLMNTSYAYEELSKMENEIYQEALPEIPASYLRWGGTSVEDFTSHHEDFNSELSIRADYVRQHLRNHYNLNGNIEITLDVSPANAGKIKINTIVPKTYPWDGIYFNDVPIKIEAIANPGYAFSGWDENKYISNTALSEFTKVMSDNSIAFIANFEPAQSTFEGITISEINYKDGSDLNTTDWFEIWNATKQELSFNGWYFTDNDSTRRYNFISGTSIAANERIVVARNLSNFQSNYPTVKSITGGFSFGLGTPMDAINLYNSSDELVVSVNYSDIYPWPLSNDLSGSTLELLNPEASLNDYDNWFKGCYKGSPAQAYNASCEYQTSYSPIVSLNGNNIIKAYPNPASDEVFLQFNIDQPMDETTIKVFNVLGALVKTETLEGIDSGSYTLNMDISGLKKQMYFISVSSYQFHEIVKLVKN